MLRARACDRGPRWRCACGDAACPGAARGEDEWFAEMDSLSSTEAVEVEVKVAGVTAVRTTVTPAVVQPNGPRCDPTAHQATVTVPSRLPQ